MKLNRYLLIVLTGLFMMTAKQTAFAQTPLLGEIKWVPYNFAPRGWVFCDGQLLQISQYSALFALVGTTYGGDGRSTFAVPDLRGRMQIHEGAGPGLATRNLGQKGGQEDVTLTAAQMPVHTHQSLGSTDDATDVTPTNSVAASKRRTRLYAPGPANTALHATAISSTGSGQSHNNMSPYTTLNCIIAVEGIFPSRN